VTIGWGILGTGRVADTSVGPAVAACAGAEIVACASRDFQSALDFAAKHGGRAHESFEKLLADDDVEIVYIATPNALHAEQVIAAARAGKHVFADKPLALSADDATRAFVACEQAGVALGINFQTRHHEGMREIRDSIAGRFIGEVLVAECEVSPGRGQLRGWRTDPRQAGLGTINNLGVHAYDLLRWLLGEEVVEVTVFTNVDRRDELETIALALLRFESGALGYVNANQAIPDFRPDLTIYASAGRVVGTSVMRPFIEGGEITIRSGGEDRTLTTQTMDAFDRSVAAFNGAVERHETPCPGGIDGVRSVELTEAIGRSAREGRAVAVKRMSLPDRAEMSR
jgi:predicted dehydrogenase